MLNQTTHSTIKVAARIFQIKSSRLNMDAAAGEQDFADLCDAMSATLGGADLASFPKTALYTTWRIPKRSGGTRVIEAPILQLKIVQHVIHQYLSKALAKRYHHELHAFIKNKGIKTAAKKHRNCVVLGKIDIKNYFESVTFDMFERAVTRHLMGLPAWLMNAVKTLCFHNGPKGISVGAPSSPSIVNIIAAGVVLPAVSSALEATFGKEVCDKVIVTTMYADDIAISFRNSKRDLPLSMRRDYDPPAEVVFGKDLLSKDPIDPALQIKQDLPIYDDPKYYMVKSLRILAVVLRKLGLPINSKKTQILGQSTRQVVCGCVVNTNASGAPRSYRRKLRKELHHQTALQIKNAGPPTTTQALNVLQGKIAHVTHLSKAHGHSLTTQLTELKRLL